MGNFCACLIWISIAFSEPSPRRFVEEKGRSKKAPQVVICTLLMYISYMRNEAGFKLNQKRALFNMIMQLPFDV